jgi:transcriptional repressor NrdR
MRCPKCNFVGDKVVDSRTAKEGVAVRRRRECLDCGYRFTTYEEVIQSELSVIKRNSSRVEFERSKLKKGIGNACWKRPIDEEKIDQIVEKVTMSLQYDFEGEVSSLEIGRRVMDELKELDEVAYVRFASVYREFKDIDQFIEEIRLLNKKNK